MNTPIKPPESTPFSQPAEQVSEVNGIEKSSKTFQEVMDASNAAEEIKRPGGASFDTIQTVVDQLKSGEIDRDRAIEILVDNALERLSPGAMPLQGRNELEKLLHTALQNDPSLIALTKGLKPREPIEK
ncbi:MAG: hypothetical protein JXA30_14105 [Deltaproteobacteria bacterium]|nr:hypothetical protein [Deltaproteobacteria bacterium]